MSNEMDIQDLEQSIVGHKTAIERKEMLNRLENNPDFKALIQEGFLEKHAVRQVLLKAHPSMQSEAHQTLLDQQITAVGGFKQFLVSVYTEGCNSAEALRSDEATLEELLKEGAEE
jgi:hypothetical protein